MPCVQGLVDRCLDPGVQLVQELVHPGWFCPFAEGPGVLVSWWWAGSGADFEAFLARREADMIWSCGGPSDALARLLLLAGCVFGI